MIVTIFLAVLACFAYRLFFQRNQFSFAHDWPVYVLSLVAGFIGYALLSWPMFLKVLNYAFIIALVGFIFFVALNNRNKIPIK